jgi:hypothetical protein
MSDVEIDVDMHGPIFDAARRTAEMHRFSREVVYDVASQGRSNWMMFLDRSIRNPTPYYETQIRVERVGEERARVHDGGVVYGPWLEGTGSRNSPVTSFAGYQSARQAAALTDAQVPVLVRPAVARLVERLGG